MKLSNEANLIRLILILGALLILLACTDVPSQQYSKIKLQPAGALQLDPAVFLDADSLKALGLVLGDVVDLVIDGQQFQGNVYPYVYGAGEMGINQFTLQRLGLNVGDHEVSIKPAKKPEIPRQVLEMHGEAYQGDTGKWGHFVISAPHGDCDLFTGEMVQAMNRDYGFPTTAYYYPRFTFLGRWFDANRPLGKVPRPDGHWTLPERIWSPEIDSIYHRYETLIRQTGGVDNEPLDFLCSFHGHDLKMNDAAGETINREVIEAYGSGFSQDEYRQMVVWFQEIGTKYFDELPLLVFGNLPESQQYEIDGQTFDFWYTGLGTRSYGTLRKSNTLRGLHMETPNSLRFDPQDRARTVKLMADFFTRIHAELLYPMPRRPEEASTEARGLGRISLEAAEFRFQDRVLGTAAFEITETEITVAQFADFLDHQLASENYRLDMPTRRIVDQNGDLVCLLDAFNPGDLLEIRENRVIAASGRENHPMTQVSWYAAAAFAKAQGGRLPTEAEWIRAAAQWDGEFHSYAAPGIEYSDLENQINFEGSLDPNDGKVYPQDLPVASLTPNGNGLYDMSGNVWEWCSDWFHSQYFRDLPNDVTTVNPQGPGFGTMRTIKGGSWAAGLEVTKTGYRVALAPQLTLCDLGFRILWEK